MTAGVILRLLLWCLSHTWDLFINALPHTDLLRITLHLDMVQIVSEYMHPYVFVKDLHLYEKFTPAALQLCEDISIQQNTKTLESILSLWMKSLFTIAHWVLNALDTL